MYAVFTICRYPRWLAWLAWLSIPVFPLIRSRHPGVLFFRMLGMGPVHGKGLRAYPGRVAICCFLNQLPIKHPYMKEQDGLPKALYGKHIDTWLEKTLCSTTTYGMELIRSMGSWDGFRPVAIEKTGPGDANIAVLTRARIRFRHLPSFWRQAAGTAQDLVSTPGLIFHTGVSEWPLTRFGTFSHWCSAQELQGFLDTNQPHQAAIRKTRQEGWYAEELFARFRVLFIITHPRSEVSLSELSEAFGK